jgi:hypothetical protein
LSAQHAMWIGEAQGLPPSRHQFHSETFSESGPTNAIFQSQHVQYFAQPDAVLCPSIDFRMDEFWTVGPPQRFMRPEDSACRKARIRVSIPFLMVAATAFDSVPVSDRIAFVGFQSPRRTRYKSSGEIPWLWAILPRTMVGLSITIPCSWALRMAACTSSSAT